MTSMMTVGVLEYLLSVVDDEAEIDFDTLIDDLNLQDERPHFMSIKTYSFTEMAEMEAKQGFYKLPDDWGAMSDEEKYAFYLSTLADDFESEGLTNLSSFLSTK